jgi:pimeloyl-ACP methyl ester carboxylesterase
VILLTSDAVDAARRPDSELAMLPEPASDTDLVYERRGSGEPVLLLHGIGSRRGVFAPVSDLLAEHHEIIAVDLPGFGDSPMGPQVDGSIEAYATAVEEFLAALGIRRPHVVGNSMGGGIALELGRRGAAASVIAFCPIGFWKRPGRTWARTTIRTMRALARLLRPALPRLSRSPSAKAVLFGTFYGHPRSLDPERAAADVDGLTGAAGVDLAIDHAGHWNPLPPAGLAAIPVTIAWGSRDALLTYATQARRARQLMPQARHITLKGSGHVPFPDDPQGCLAAILETTAKAEAGAER